MQYDFPSILALGIVAASLSLSAVLGLRLRRLQLHQDDAVARARDRFARDAHDLVGHWLMLASMKGELVLQRAGADLTPDLADMVHAVRSAAGELRDLTSTYRGISLREEASRAGEVLGDFGAPCDVQLPEEELSREHSSLLGTVVREGVTNVLRHSRATHCSIRVFKDHGWVCLTIENDGADTVRSRSGQGLGNLDSRAGELGGRVTTDLQKDGHFRLTAQIPPGRRACQ
ncbi:sensor histidine kinase [Nonomuraea sp. NPDC050556]|uniref:sensor histidine kinase n=1 Tax=Nonomuraea sp. NPDC050556 TaxID=3364369 RepID=UPI003794566B